MSEFLLPVPFQTLVIHSEKVSIYYPYVMLPNQQIQQSINQKIYSVVHQLIAHQQSIQTGELQEMLGHFEIKTNERGLLSILFSNYAYSAPMAHGMTVVQSLNFNVKTGQEYQLQDLFKPNSNYIQVLSKQIEKQIKERDIPLLGNFTTIRPNQDFYLSDKCLVIYFRLYEITPYYVGFPMFPISVYSLEDIINPNGPLSILSIAVV
ncbi:RsiV family protein [Radiobacillus sp. PE A8.2]|uniref:RsiV family protein n=1 Tax=Radiobacillus sp. PE A8.2 TaxID=3380349 RepID=UPI00388F9227